MSKDINTPSVMDGDINETEMKAQKVNSVAPE